MTLFCLRILFYLTDGGDIGAEKIRVKPRENNRFSSRYSGYSSSGSSGVSSEVPDENYLLTLDFQS